MADTPIDTTAKVEAERRYRGPRMHVGTASDREVEAFITGAMWAFESIDRDDLARVLDEHRIECTGPGEVTCRGCREKRWMTWATYHQHQADVVLAFFRGETGR